MKKRSYVDGVLLLIIVEMLLMLVCLRGGISPTAVHPTVHHNWESLALDRRE